MAMKNIAVGQVDDGIGRKNLCDDIQISAVEDFVNRAPDQRQICRLLRYHLLAVLTESFPQHPTTVFFVRRSGVRAGRRRRHRTHLLHDVERVEVPERLDSLTVLDAPEVEKSERHPLACRPDALPFVAESTLKDEMDKDQVSFRDQVIHGMVGDRHCAAQADAKLAELLWPAEPLRDHGIGV